MNSTFTPDAQKTIGERIARIVQTEDITQVEFSRRLQKMRPNWRPAYVSDLVTGKRFPTQEFTAMIDEVYAINLLDGTGVAFDSLRYEDEHPKAWMKRTKQIGASNGDKEPPAKPKPKQRMYRVFVDKNEQTLSMYDNNNYIGTCTAEDAGISLDDFENGWQNEISFAHVERISAAVNPLANKMTEELEKWVANQNANATKEKGSVKMAIDPQVTPEVEESVTVTVRDGVVTVTVAGFSMSMSEGEFTIGGGNAHASSRVRARTAANRGITARIFDTINAEPKEWHYDQHIAGVLDVPVKVVRSSASYLLSQGKVDRIIKTDGHYFSVEGEDG